MIDRPPAALVLADGEVFLGEAAGADPDDGIATGEVVFNTSMTGYQEVVTDPSYAGQIVTFTNPHVGNYGACGQDNEADHPTCRGIVVRDLARRSSSWRATEGFEDLLRRTGVAAMTGVDTRRLTRHVRRFGAMPAALGTAPTGELLAAAQAEPGTAGRDLVSAATRPVPEAVGAGRVRFVAVDLGIKASVVDQLGALGRVEVVAASTSPGDILGREPDGVVLSNGPGDPSALEGSIRMVRELLGRIPILGICLGHQLLGAALGAPTYKLTFGHHGANHPVRDLATGRVEITSQNHNYAVRVDDLAGVAVTHVSLNDGVIEGIEVPDAAAIGVQFHPEAAPGPHDARHHLARFRELIDR